MVQLMAAFVAAVVVLLLVRTVIQYTNAGDASAKLSWLTVAHAIAHVRELRNHGKHRFRAVVSFLVPLLGLALFAALGRAYVDGVYAVLLAMLAFDWAVSFLRVLTIACEHHQHDEWVRYRVEWLGVYLLAWGSLVDTTGTVFVHFYLLVLIRLDNDGLKHLPLWWQVPIALHLSAAQIPSSVSFLLLICILELAASRTELLCALYSLWIGDLLRVFDVSWAPVLVVFVVTWRPSKLLPAPLRWSRWVGSLCSTVAFLVALK